MNSRIIAGTSKGLVIVARVGRDWKIASVAFPGLDISMFYVDERTNTWWVGISHRHWGEKLHRSDDEGNTWQEALVPGYADLPYKAGKPATLRRIWTMQHAGADQPGGLWMGTEPGGLFYSGNGGQSFHLNMSLWDHPSRLDDQKWFGAGKDYPFIHSIVLDPRDSDHLMVGVSCAGVFDTRDGGKTWQARNNGLIAAYLPDPVADVGHDPHKLLSCPINPDVLWQQNHCGIFRTANAAESWADMSDKSGFPRYGFALAIDEQDPDTAWVIPAHSDEQRIPVDLKLTVFKTQDGGKSWISKNKGLPGSNAFDLVLRHAFAKQNDLMAFGTNNGNLYVSEDTGESWNSISQNLSTVNSVIITP
jgi:photosystem II stability/assembly factor-like uncharacterized protein